MGVLGFKWINCYMNPALGYPFGHDSIIVLNDIMTGSLKAIVSAQDITAMRTAGGYGVVSEKYLACAWHPYEKALAAGDGIEFSL